MNEFRRRLGWVFQHFPFGGGVQQVCVDGEGGLAALVLGDLDAVLFGEGEQICAGFEIPVAPRSDDLDVGVQAVIAQLEADLVIALAGCAMTDRVCADHVGNLDLAFGDQRAGNRGAEQVDAFIDGIGAEHREDEVADEFLAHVFDEDVLRLDPGGKRLGAGRLQLLALSEICGEGDDFGAEFRLQPFQDDRRVQSAGIGEHDFFRSGNGHEFVPSMGPADCGDAIGGKARPDKRCPRSGRSRNSHKTLCQEG